MAAFPVLARSFTSPCGVAVAALSLSNKVSLTATNSALSKGVRETDLRLRPSVALAHLCSNATPLLPHTRTRTTMTATAAAAATKAPLPLTLPERARARAHTPHAARVDRSADRTASDPRPQGRTCARSRPSTSKPSEDARNADKVDRRDKKKEGSEEGKADRYEMLHSRTRSFAEYTPARARSDLGGSERGRGAAVDNRQIQIRVMSLIM